MAGGSLTVNRDPRMAHMLSASQDTTNGNGGYRGVDPALGDPFSATTTGTNARKRVATLWEIALMPTQVRLYLLQLLVNSYLKIKW
jgi:hypothetical protein